jgi:hypothetical protein
MENGDGAVLLGAGDALEEGARRTGIICSGCGGLMDDSAGDCTEFVTLKPPVVTDGTPTVRIAKAFVCGRPECDEVRAHLRQSSTGWRPMAPFAHINVGEE